MRTTRARIALLFCFALLLSAVSIDTADAWCPYYEDIFCGLECGGEGPGIWCADESWDETICCFDSGVHGGACGVSPCSECAGCGPSGLF